MSLSAYWNSLGVLNTENGGTGLSSPGNSGNILTSNGSGWVSLPTIFTKTGTLINPTTQQNIIGWEAPYNCTLIGVSAYTSHDVGQVIQTRQNGVTYNLNSNYTITTAETWKNCGSLSATSFSQGDKLEFCYLTVSGAPTAISIQLFFSVP